MTEETKTAENAEPDEATLSDAEIVARRSADIHDAEAKDGEHVKVFVLPPGPKPTEANGYDHEANKAATKQYAISQGMRPTDDVRLVSIKQHRNKVSWVLTYAVPVAVAERIAEPSEPHIVTGGDGAEVNTDGSGHTSNTDPNLGDGSATAGTNPDGKPAA